MRALTTPSRLFPGSSVVEQPAVNRLVAGSNPARGANSLFACSKRTERLAGAKMKPRQNAGAYEVLRFVVLTAFRSERELAAGPTETIIQADATDPGRVVVL